MNDDDPDREPLGTETPESEKAAAATSPGGDASSEAGTEAALEAEGRLEAAGKTPSTKDQPEAERRESAAGLVAGGILLSRLIGFVRERGIGYFFGVGPHADVFRVALRAPNLLQNLLGEGTISAAFIPIYSRMLEDGRPEDAGRFAGAVLGLLTALVAALVTLGIVLAEPLTALLQPGWLGDADKVIAGEIAVDRYRLAVRSVQITFPMTGLLVLSAWALGVLNSHRKFFLPYFAPVFWNAAIIGALIWAGFTLFDDPTALDALDVIPVDALNRLLFAGLWGALLGGALQVGVQLPTVLRVTKGLRPSLSTKVEGVKQSFRAFLPVVAGRGVYQLSGYLDLLLAGFAAVGAISALTYAQVLYTLPVSLFAMSVAASELPELSRLSHTQPGPFLGRIDASLRQILFMVVPSVVGFLVFGFLVVAVLYQTGSFDLDDTWLVYFVLGAYALGLLATTASRLLQNAFYALDDTKTPARIAVARVAVSAAIGAGLMFWLDRYSVPEVVGIEAEGRPLRLGAVGLALGASVGAWVELWRLVSALRAKVSGFRLPVRRTTGMIGVALAAAVPAGLLRWFVPAEPFPVWAYGAVILAVFGVGYLVLAHVLGFDEGDAWTGKLTRRFRKG